jgi:hypothetical protein
MCRNGLVNGPARFPWQLELDMVTASVRVRLCVVRASPLPPTACDAAHVCAIATIQQRRSARQLGRGSSAADVGWTACAARHVADGAATAARDLAGTCTARIFGEKGWFARTRPAHVALCRGMQRQWYTQSVLNETHGYKSAPAPRSATETPQGVFKGRSAAEERDRPHR